MKKRAVVFFVAAVASFVIGLLATYATGWRWWIRICVALGPPVALIVAERIRLVKTPEELNRPLSLFPKDDD